MTSDYAEALVKVFRETVEAQEDEWDDGEELIDLLAALKQESPERYEQLLEETGYNRIVLGEDDAQSS